MKKGFLILLSVLSIFVLSTFFYLLILDRNSSDVPSALIGKKVPSFEKEMLFNKKNFRSPEAFQEKVSIVNFFATWCAPCRIEHPLLIELRKNPKMQIIGINYKDDLKKTKQWLNEEGNPYHNIVIDNDGMLAIDWGAYGIPETFIINKKGVVIFRQIGPLTSENYEKFHTKLLEVINE